MRTNAFFLFAVCSYCVCQAIQNYASNAHVFRGLYPVIGLAALSQTPIAAGTHIDVMLDLFF